MEYLNSAEGINQFIRDNLVDYEPWMYDIESRPLEGEYHWLSLVTHRNNRANNMGVIIQLHQDPGESSYEIIDYDEAKETMLNIRYMEYEIINQQRIVEGKKPLLISAMEMGIKYNRIFSENFNKNKKENYLLKETFNSISLRRVNDALYGSEIESKNGILVKNKNLIELLHNHYPYRWNEINEAHIVKHSPAKEAYSPQYNNHIIFWLGHDLSRGFPRDELLGVTVGKKILFVKGGLTKQKRILGQPETIDKPIGKIKFGISSVKKLSEISTEVFSIDINILEQYYKL